MKSIVQSACDEWLFGLLAAGNTALALWHIEHGRVEAAAATSMGYALGWVAIPLGGFTIKGAMWLWDKVRKRPTA